MLTVTPNTMTSNHQTAVALQGVSSLLDSDLSAFARIGISPDLLAQAMVERVTDQTARQKYGTTGHGDMSGIAFPYIDPKDGRRKTTRIRRDNPEIEAGKPKRKYVSVHGDRRHLYFPPGCAEVLTNPTIPIILVEAEKSALALTAFAQRVGRNCLPIAMGGCWGWRGRIGKVENERGERVDELGPLPDLECASGGRPVVILLDSNASTNPIVQRAEGALRSQLIKQGASVLIAKLPPIAGVNGPDDYIGVAGDDAMAAVLDTARTTTDGGLMDGQLVAKRRAQALLLELGSNFEFFHTGDRDPFASVLVNGHMETLSLASREFAYMLRHRYYCRTRSAPPKQALEDAINIFASRALFDGTEQQVFLRVGQFDGKIYLDLGDPTWSAVEISASGWSVATNHPVKFWRSRGMRPLPHPMAGGNINELRSFLNIADQEWPLVLAWILAAYRPRGPFPILILSGEQGSCKSSASSVLKSLLDPNVAALRSAPRDERDLFIAANNSSVITLDNLSHLPDWLSDTLCRLATGGGLATRQLYSDLNETIINVQRPIILNGIAELARRGDLLDRSIVVSLPTLDPEKRRDEAEFESEFESQKQKLFGALLSALSAALAHLPRVKLDRKPRMADFALFGVAVERGIGWAPGTFIKAYETNRSTANSSAIEASPVALAVQSFVADGQEFEGSFSDLLNELSSWADDQAKRHKSWPDSGWKLSGVLRRLAPDLRAAGVDITLDKRTSDRKRTRVVRIGKTVSDASGLPNNAEIQPSMRTHTDDPTSPSDGPSPQVPCSTSARTCVADAPEASDASDALTQTAFLRGEL